MGCFPFFGVTASLLWKFPLPFFCKFRLVFSCKFHLVFFCEFHCVALKASSLLCFQVLVSFVSASQAFLVVMWFKMLFGIRRVSPLSSRVSPLSSGVSSPSSFEDFVSQGSYLTFQLFDFFCLSAWVSLGPSVGSGSLFSAPLALGPPFCLRYPVRLAVCVIHAHLFIQVQYSCRLKAPPP